MCACTRWYKRLLASINNSLGALYSLLNATKLDGWIGQWKMLRACGKVGEVLIEMPMIKVVLPSKGLGGIISILVTLVWG